MFMDFCSPPTPNPLPCCHPPWHMPQFKPKDNSWTYGQQKTWVLAMAINVAALSNTNPYMSILHVASLSHTLALSLSLSCTQKQNTISQLPAPFLICLMQLQFYTQKNKIKISVFKPTIFKYKRSQKVSKFRISKVENKNIILGSVYFK